VAGTAARTAHRLARSSRNGYSAGRTGGCQAVSYFSHFSQILFFLEALFKTRLPDLRLDFFLLELRFCEDIL
jgi:hypothetical protein